MYIIYDLYSSKGCSTILDVLAREPNWDLHEYSKRSICRGWPMGSKKKVLLQLKSKRRGPNSVMASKKWITPNNRRQLQLRIWHLAIDTHLPAPLPPDIPNGPPFFGLVRPSWLLILGSRSTSGALQCTWSYWWQAWRFLKYTVTGCGVLFFV